MKMKLIAISGILCALSMIIVLCLLIKIQTTTIANIELWPDLKPGPFPVGYKLLYTYDGSRSFGKLAKRPIQITVWYPAIHDAKGQHLTIDSYLLSAATEVDFSLREGQLKTKQRDEVLGWAIEAGAEVGRLNRVLTRKTLSIQEVPPAPGLFPLLLYAPGRNGAAFQSLVLCEYLASHGYVVAACPSFGSAKRDISTIEEGLETGQRDLGFVITEAGKLPGVDSKRIGLIGFSLGGMSAPLLAMHNEAVGALLLLDPGFRVSKNFRILQRSPSYQPQSIWQPILLMLAKGKGSVPDLSFIQATSAKDLNIVVFHNLYHGDFGSVIIELFVHPIVGKNVRDIAGIDFGYANVCRYARAFFDSHLKADQLGAAFLRRRPEENGIPAGLLKIEHVPQVHSSEKND